MRQQYHFRQYPSAKNNTVYDTHIWNVNRLIKMAQSLPVTTIKLTDIKEIDENYWYGSHGSVPTCRSIVNHMQLINKANPIYPILLCHEGKIIDGMHRVCKALMAGETHIKARQFSSYIEPDYINVDETTLPYD